MHRGISTPSHVCVFFIVKCFNSSILPNQVATSKKNVSPDQSTERLILQLRSYTDLENVGSWSIQKLTLSKSDCNPIFLVIIVFLFDLGSENPDF